MARFRNQYGSIVSVADEKAYRFTAGWEPVEDEKPKAKTASKKPASKPAAK